MAKEEEPAPPDDGAVAAEKEDVVPSTGAKISRERRTTTNGADDRRNNNINNNVPPESGGVSIVIRAKKDIDRKLLVAATRGDIAYLESVRRGGEGDGDPREEERTGIDGTEKGEGRKSKREGIDRGTKVLRDAVCVSGCTLLHWAAGSNQVGVLEYLLSTEGAAVFRDDDDGDDGASHHAVDLPVTRCKKSLGRTPLHYACRNGCLDAVRWLVTVGGASISVAAKQGVTPFQLAVWQNRLDVCVFLTEAAASSSGGGDPSGRPRFDPAGDFNDFGCGAVHWLGIAPESRANCNRRECGGGGDDDGSCWYDDGRDLLPLAWWLGELPGIDFGARQRQNHTALHKASWGGHLALVEHLHAEHDMWDDVVDDAGNYAASLADMAHTPKHARIAEYLRHRCSRKRAESLAILGLLEPSGAGAAPPPGKERIRRAYLAKARQLHPDRLTAAATATAAGPGADGNDDDAPGESKPPAIGFDELRKAYLHLTEEGGVGDQSNPAHSLNLMLRYVNDSGGGGGGGGVDAEKNPNESTATGAADHGVAKSDDGEDDDGEDDASFFKARLVAVLLEYGDKGIDLSNVKKKWKQVWPKIPFPSQQREAVPGRQARKVPMAEFLMEKAGDVIRFERRGDKKRRVVVLLKDRSSSKESVLRSASVVATEEEEAAAGGGERQ